MKGAGLEDVQGRYSSCYHIYYFSTNSIKYAEDVQFRFIFQYLFTQNPPKKSNFVIWFFLKMVLFPRKSILMLFKYKYENYIKNNFKYFNDGKNAKTQKNSNRSANIGKQIIHACLWRDSNLGTLKAWIEYIQSQEALFI